ncbi:hypothetical protein E1B28_009108 [Marasmius oreades]|uniref:Extracellular metalloproteinase n=1 Tax=Marasmius oreades TaxID=181124 RepID=A0A9P7RZS4_9AGAR|nr:uncharacterized protein E1B28_009108 [Marasmius oreades]KAG7092786.1 hypothetical protein E1B28_009108 [Marasmius oreades]
MGGGWSDAVANWMAQTSADTKNKAALAKSTAFDHGRTLLTPQVNPLKYPDVGRRREVHQIGEVWANTLHTVYADLGTDLGFTAEAKTNPDAKEGNALFVKLMVTALATRPSSPLEMPLFKLTRTSTTVLTNVL